MRVRLRIESLTIEGLGLMPHHEPALRAALAAELAELFAGQERFSASRQLRITARIPKAADHAPESLGRQIAAAIHGSVPRHAQ